ncbi:hypothetical protein Sgou_19130 [Streptomyces gougerotii]|uniref:Uncharacterized protein n=1 Tax=Streptomyces gougerotii TaxID=53448 RepID=A0ABQ1D3W1_9ACTN|nr:hypothetical protein Sgou_19130 [Streptomyces gougerotii]
MAFAAGAGAEEGDPAAAEAEQVADGLAGGGDVVDGDVVVGRLVLALAEQDEGGGAGAAGEVLGLQVDGAEDQAVDDLRPEALADQEFVLAQPRGVVDEHGVVVAGGGVDDGAGQFGEVSGCRTRGRPAR